MPSGGDGEFPHRLLPLRDIISEELMRHPDMVDHDGEACLRTASRLASPPDELLEPSLTSESTLPARLLRRLWNGPYSPTITTRGSFPQVEIPGPSLSTALATTMASSLAVLAKRHHPTSPTPIWWLLAVIKARISRCPPLLDHRVGGSATRRATRAPPRWSHLDSFAPATRSSTLRFFPAKSSPFSTLRYLWVVCWCRRSAE